MGWLLIIAVILFFVSFSCVTMMGRVSHNAVALPNYKVQGWALLLSLSFLAFCLVAGAYPGYFLIGFFASMALAGIFNPQVVESRFASLFLAVYLGAWFSLPYGLGVYFFS